MSKAHSRARFAVTTNWKSSPAPRPRAALTSFAHVAVSNSVFTTKPKGYPTKNGAVAGSPRACLGIHLPADRRRGGIRSSNCVGCRRRIPGVPSLLRPAAAETREQGLLSFYGYRNASAATRAPAQGGKMMRAKGTFTCPICGYATWKSRRAPRRQAAPTRSVPAAVSSSVITAKTKAYLTKSGAAAGSPRACPGLIVPLGRP